MWKEGTDMRVLTMKLSLLLLSTILLRVLPFCLIIHVTWVPYVILSLLEGDALRFKLGFRINSVHLYFLNSRRSSMTVI